MSGVVPNVYAAATFAVVVPLAILYLPTRLEPPPRIRDPTPSEIGTLIGLEFVGTMATPNEHVLLGLIGLLLIAVGVIRAVRLRRSLRAVM